MTWFRSMRNEKWLWYSVMSIEWVARFMRLAFSAIWEASLGFAWLSPVGMATGTWDCIDDLVDTTSHSILHHSAETLQGLVLSCVACYVRPFWGIIGSCSIFSSALAVPNFDGQTLNFHMLGADISRSNWRIRGNDHPSDHHPENFDFAILYIVFNIHTLHKQQTSYYGFGAERLHSKIPGELCTYQLLYPVSLLRSEGGPHIPFSTAWGHLFESDRFGFFLMHVVSSLMGIVCIPLVLLGMRAQRSEVLREEAFDVFCWQCVMCCVFGQLDDLWLDRHPSGPAGESAVVGLAFTDWSRDSALRLPRIYDESMPKMNMNPSTRSNDHQWSKVCWAIGGSLLSFGLLLAPPRAGHLNPPLCTTFASAAFGEDFASEAEWSQTQQIIIDHHPVALVVDAVAVAVAAVGSGVSAVSDYTLNYR